MPRKLNVDKLIPITEFNKKFCGIYICLCLTTGKYYLGSSIEFVGRQRNHINLAKKGCHHSNRFQDAWNKYGENSFVFLKIRDCKQENTKIIEQFYLDRYQPWRMGMGFNKSRAASCSIGENNGMFGRKHSIKTKQHWSKIRKNKKLSEEQKIKRRVTQTKNNHYYFTNINTHKVFYCQSVRFFATKNGLDPRALTRVWKLTTNNKGVIAKRHKHLRKSTDTEINNYKILNHV